MRAIVALLFVVAINVHAGVAEDAAQKDVLSFGVVPQASAGRLAEIWIPVLNYLEQQTGQRFVFRTTPTVDAFTQKLGRGEYDVAYMNPVHYGTFLKSYHYAGIATETRPLHGIIVTARQNEQNSLKSLAGQTLCLPAPQSFAATQVTLKHLALQGIRVETRYVGSHDSVYRLVAAGYCAAGGGVTRTLDLMEPELRNRLRTLWESHPLPNHVFAVSRKVPLAVRGKIQWVLLAMPADLIGASLLRAAGIESLADVDDSRYAVLSLTPKRTAERDP